MTSVQATIIQFTTQNRADSSLSTNKTEENGFDALLSGLSSKDCETAKTAAPNAQGGNNDSLIAMVQQIVLQTTSFLLPIGNKEDTQASSISNSISGDMFGDADEGFITGDGPLPAFLARVDRQYGLDATQQKALRDIALRFRDTDGSLESRAQIAQALASAGIGTAPQTFAV